MNLTQRICAVTAFLAVSVGAGAQESKVAGAVSGLVNVQQSAGVRQYRLARPMGLPMVSGCAAATVLRVRETAGRVAIGEPPLVEWALRTGRPLKLTGARCEADGSVSATGVALEPESATSAELCSLPLARGSAPQCK